MSDDPVRAVVNSWYDLPDFATEAEEAEFWATHELGPDLLAAMRPVRCPHCPDGHRRPGSKPFAVWVGSERDSDGQPTTLHVAYAAGHHVSEAEAEYVRAALSAALSSEDQP